MKSKGYEKYYANCNIHSLYKRNYECQCLSDSIKYGQLLRRNSFAYYLELCHLLLLYDLVFRIILIISLCICGEKMNEAYIMA